MLSYFLLFCYPYILLHLCLYYLPCKVRQLVSKSMNAKKDRNGPPSANHGSPTAEPKHSHAACTLQVHPLTSPCPTFSANAEPISKGQRWKWQNEAAILTMSYIIWSHCTAKPNCCFSKCLGYITVVWLFLPMPIKRMQWLQTSTSLTAVQTRSELVELLH